MPRDTWPLQSASALPVLSPSANSLNDADTAEKAGSLIWLRNGETGERQDAVSELLTRTKVMAISSHSHSPVANE
eukprot:10861654-Prorocentrum_lima.AAC.1